MKIIQINIFNFKSANSLLVSYVNKILVLWLTVNNIRPWQKLLFLFYVKKYFRIKKRRRQKLMTLLINQVLYAPFDKMNMIHMTITKAQLQSLRWDLRYPSLIYWKILLLLKQFSSLGTDLPCHVGFSFFDFLIHISTETTHNLCPFEFKCSIQSLAKIVT